MINQKKILLFVFFFLILPSITWAYTVTFTNPIDTTGTMTMASLFEAILAGILNLIASLGVLFIVIGGVIYLMASSSGNDALVGTAKKIWTGSLIGLALALAGPGFLRQIKEIIGTTPTDLDSAPSLTVLTTNTLTFLLSIIGILAIISLVLNGISYLTSFGNPTKTEKAKTNVGYSLLGILIAGSALVVVKQIALFFE